MEPCYIEFFGNNEHNISKLNNIVEIIDNDKRNQIKEIDKKWIKLLTDNELAHFWWPNEEQYEEIKKRWGDVYIKISPDINNLQKDWDIYSMFEALKDGEYEFLGIQKIGNNHFKLEFNPLAYPFGGTDSICKLISCFGFKVIAKDDGTGRLILNKNGLYEKKPWWKIW